MATTSYIHRIHKTLPPTPPPPLSYNDPGSHEQSFGETEEQRNRRLFLKANGNGGVKPGISASRSLAANSQMRWVITRIVISGPAAGQSGAGPEKPSL